MKAKDMILPEIPLLTPGMSVKQGLATMQMSGLSSLPIVDEGSYVGVVHEKELLRDDVAGKIGRENWRTPSVREESHLFDVVNQLAQYSDDILPVVTTDRHYVGAISIHSALVAVAHLCQTSSSGAIIELEIPREVYSATELTRLVEDNDCRVMNLMIRPDEKTGIWKACLRIDREDAALVLRSLERFDYRVVSCYQLHGVMDERIEQRIKELMYYLEM